MKLKYYIIILVCFLQNSVYSMEILDSKMSYVECNVKINLQFNYPFSNRNDLENRLLGKIDSDLIYLQRIAEHTQIGFKTAMSRTLKYDTWIDDLSKFDAFKNALTEGYLIFKNQKFGSLEYGKGRLVSQNMLINTSKFKVGAGGISSNWANYVNLPGVIAKPGSDLKLGSWKVISYISPEITNLQVGLSYEHSSKVMGSGIAYKSSLTDKVTIATAVTGEFAEQLKHWSGGLYLEYSQLGCILSYGNMNERDVHYMNAGVKYHSESNKLSLTYFTSHGQDGLSAYAISIERPLVMGTSYYVDLVKFNTNEPKGYVLLAGLKVNL